MKPGKYNLTIFGVTEKDAGNYTVVLTNKITKEEMRRSFQLLVNGMYAYLLSDSSVILMRHYRSPLNLISPPQVSICRDMYIYVYISNM